MFHGKFTEDRSRRLIGAQTKKRRVNHQLEWILQSSSLNFATRRCSVTNADLICLYLLHRSGSGVSGPFSGFACILHNFCLFQSVCKPTIWILETCTDKDCRSAPASVSWHGGVISCPEPDQLMQLYEYVRANVRSQHFNQRQTHRYL